MSKQHRRYNTDDDDGDRLLADGESIHVRMDMMDSAQRAVRRHFSCTTTTDAIRATGLHKPGPVQDALSNVRMSTQDAARLAGAIAGRQFAFDQLEERSRNAWKNGPPSMNAMPPPPPEPAAQWDDPDSD
jgi:hypothetical protein